MFSLAADREEVRQERINNLKKKELFAQRDRITTKIRRIKELQKPLTELAQQKLDRMEKYLLENQIKLMEIDGYKPPPNGFLFLRTLRNF